MFPKRSKYNAEGRNLGGDFVLVRAEDVVWFGLLLMNVDRGIGSHVHLVGAVLVGTYNRKDDKETYDIITLCRDVVPGTSAEQRMMSLVPEVVSRLTATTILGSFCEIYELPYNTQRLLRDKLNECFSRKEKEQRREQGA